MVSKTDEAEESDKPIKKSDIDQLITAIPGRQVSQKLEERWSETVEAGKNINCPCKVTMSSLCAVLGRVSILIVVDGLVMYVLTLYSTKYGLFTFYMCKGKQNRKKETLRRVAMVANCWIAMNLGPAKMVEKKRKKLTSTTFLRMTALKEQNDSSCFSSII